MASKERDTSTKPIRIPRPNSIALSAPGQQSRESLKEKPVVHQFKLNRKRSKKSMESDTQKSPSINPNPQTHTHIPPPTPTGSETGGKSVLKRWSLRKKKSEPQNGESSNTFRGRCNSEHELTSSSAVGRSEGTVIGNAGSQLEVDDDVVFEQCDRLRSMTVTAI